MDIFLDFFSLFVTEHSTLAFGVLFLAVMLEGELSLIMAGIFVHLGIFSLWPTLIIAALAAIAKTLIGYRIGAYLGRKMPNSIILKYFERRILYFLPRFRERPFWSIVVSKCIYGVNNIAIIFAGYMRADFRKYLLAEFISTFVWFGGMFLLGSFATSKALSLSDNFRTFSLVIVLFMIGFMILLKLIAAGIEIVEEWTEPSKEEVSKQQTEKTEVKKEETTKEEAVSK